MFPSFDSAWSTIDSIDLSSLTDDLTPKKQQKPQQQQTSFAPTVTFSPPPKMMMDDLFSSPPPPPPPSAASASTALKTGAEHAPLHFTEVNKMSLFSLEKRIDYHLSRIMKGHRLINFKNSIERLSTEKRICECILEVLMSSKNLISRKAKIILESKEMAEYMELMAGQVLAARKQLATSGGNSEQQLLDSGAYCRRYLAKLAEVKTLAIGLEQIVWALNSNKEHIKYIVKVFTVPGQYQRSEFSTDLSSIVPLRAVISKVIGECEQAIGVCRLLRAQLSDALIKCFLNHF